VLLRGQKEQLSSNGSCGMFGGRVMELNGAEPCFWIVIPSVARTPYYAFASSVQ